jgi:hypothetical protein
MRRELLEVVNAHLLLQLGNTGRHVREAESRRSEDYRRRDSHQRATVAPVIGATGKLRGRAVTLS